MGLTAEELPALCALVDRHGGRVFADEIHAPLAYPGRTRMPYASLSATAAGPGDVLRERCGVALVDGPSCGAPGRGHARLNFATPCPVLELVVRRMAEAVRERPPLGPS